MMDRVDIGAAVLVQNDDRILVWGEFNRMNNAPLNPLVRLHRDGSTDATFNGSAVDDFDVWALDSSNRLILAGFPYVMAGNEKRILRLNVDGSIDPTFNSEVAVGDWLVSQVVPLSDGKIVVLLHNIQSSVAPRVVRLNADGTVDSTFVPVYPNRAISLAAQSDGKVLVGLHTDPAPGSHPTLLVRLNTDGSNDPTFKTDFPDPTNGWFPFVISILPQPDGRILVAHGYGLVMRLLADGSPDPTFQALEYSGARFLLLQADGKIWISPRVRLNGDGTRDLSLQTSNLGYTLAQQSDGKLITGGVFAAPPFVTRRLSLDGAIDPTFSMDGRPVLAEPGYVFGGIAMPSGKTVIWGEFNRIGNLSRTTLARLDSTGKLDETFDATEADLHQQVRRMKVAPDGRLVLVFDNRIVRLLDDGKIDRAFPDIGGAELTTVDFQGDGKILMVADMESTEGTPTARPIVALSIILSWSRQRTK